MAKCKGKDLDLARPVGSRFFVNHFRHAPQQVLGLHHAISLIVGIFKAPSMGANLTGTPARMRRWAETHAASALRPILWRQLKIGTRVVSHDFDMGSRMVSGKDGADRGKNRADDQFAWIDSGIRKLPISV